MSLNPLILEECPPVMSLGKRIAQGFKFVWDQEQCLLFTPNGDRVTLQVEHNVPVLVQEVNISAADLNERLKCEGDAYAGEEVPRGVEPHEPGGHDGADDPNGDVEGENEEEEEPEELPAK
eukprot:793344-Amphidinium_carterae.4